MATLDKWHFIDAKRSTIVTSLTVSLSVFQQAGTHVTIQHPVMQDIYDQFVVERPLDSSRNYSKTEPLTYENSLNGDTYFTNESKLLTYISK